MNTVLRYCRKPIAALFVCMISLLQYGCVPMLFSSKGNTYLYSYLLEEPQKSNDLLFKNDYIIIQFKFDESALRFQLQNVSGAPLSIVWERVALGVNNRFYTVKNSSTLYTLNNVPPSSIEVPPLGYFRDVVIPSENIYVAEKQWIEKELFPTKDRNSAALKSAITEYVFVFRVRSVQPLPAGTELPPKDRPPAPPVSKRETGFNQQMIAVLIASGVLGVAVFLMSQKKTSAL
jgi:hypothetical protein